LRILNCSKFYRRRRGEIFVPNVSRIEQLRRFKQQHFDFFVRYGTMLDAARHNHKLAFAQFDGFIAKFERKLPRSAINISSSFS
jgi:hypothetical protein